MGRIEGIQARCQGLGPVGSKPSIPRDGPVTSGVCSPFPQEVWRSISRNGIGRKWEVGMVSCKEEVFLNKVIQEALIHVASIFSTAYLYTIQPVLLRGRLVTIPNYSLRLFISSPISRYAYSF